MKKKVTVPQLIESGRGPKGTEGTKVKLELDDEGSNKRFDFLFVCWYLPNFEKSGFVKVESKVKWSSTGAGSFLIFFNKD